MRGLLQRTGGRAVEGARLESVYTFIAYRGFESPSVRQDLSFEPATQRFDMPGQVTAKISFHEVNWTITLNFGLIVLKFGYVIKRCGFYR